MDSLLASAARSLARGAPLEALKLVALRDDAPSLALRGIAMAQLGEYGRARQLLRQAARGFGAAERVSKARCQVAEAEVALAARDLTSPAPPLAAAAEILHAHHDFSNARHARLIAARRHLLLGQLAAAEQDLADRKYAMRRAPHPLVARAELLRAELALRRIHTADATDALERAQEAARAAGIPALEAEVERVRTALSAPAARLIRNGRQSNLTLREVEAALDSRELVVDGCRRGVYAPAHRVSLASRPVLFALVRQLAEAWPADISREALIADAFAVRHSNESHRARLRVEMARLRVLLRPLARIEATRAGFVLIPRRLAGVVVLAPPLEGPTGAIGALLEDGESWSTSALACALGWSQRTVQRALRQLEQAAAVRSVGHGRSRRWLAPALTGFTTTLLLPVSPSMG